MKLLLDTHVLIWARSAPKKLNSKARKALENPQNDLWLSPVTILELADLERRGRLDWRVDFESWIEESISELGCSEAVVTNQVVFESRGLSLPHNDPADRLLAATAVEFDLTLLTADDKLLGARRIPTMRAD